MGWGRQGRLAERIGKEDLKTYSARVDGQHVDVVAVRLDHAVQETILATENNG